MTTLNNLPLLHLIFSTFNFFVVDCLHLKYCDCHLYFAILKQCVLHSLEMCEEEGGGCVELSPGGRDIEVTALNVYDYVRKYAQYRMLLSQEKALEVILSNIHLVFDLIFISFSYIEFVY